MTADQLKGSIVALVTPFKNNEVDYTNLENLIEFHVENRTDGFVILGTTAETPALASDEKESIINFAIHKINKRKPVIVGTGTNNLQATISNTIRAQKLGADAALVVTPYYNKPTQQGLYDYYAALVEQTDIPIILYNVPGRTGVNMSPETTLKLANDFPQIIATKEASASIVQASEILRDAPAGFVLLSGEDALNMPLMACGAKGTISVTANVAPKLMHNLIQACLDNDYVLAQKLHLELLELNSMMFIETNPIPAKEALHLMGKMDAKVRLPLSQLKAENIAKLKTTLQKYKFI